MSTSPASINTMVSSNNLCVQTGNLWEDDYIESFKGRRHQALFVADQAELFRKHDPGPDPRLARFKRHSGRTDGAVRVRRTA